jgi:hypothetical protein
VGVRERFRHLVSRQPARYALAELLPVRLARAATQVLDTVDGAGISVVAPPGMRIPIGASDTDAATAERLQFTFGEGPCLQAARTGLPVFAGPEEYAASWPLLYEELISRCPYRTVISQPLLHRSVPFGSLNLNHLAADPHLPVTIWSDTRAVAEEIAVTLTAEPRNAPREDGTLPSTPEFRTEPAWLNSSPARRRQQVWIAVGMLSLRLDLDSADALAELRGLAFTRGQDLDHYADDLVHRRIPLPDL